MSAAADLTHCGRCGRKLRKREYVNPFDASGPKGISWLGHAGGLCGIDIGPAATAEQVREAKARLAAREAEVQA